METGADPCSDTLGRVVKLNRNATYELQAFWGQPQGEQGLAAWIAHSAAIEREHGASLLMTFRPVKALYGAYLPTLVRLLAWPDADTFDGLQRDSRYLDLAARLEEEVTESTITLLQMHPEIHAYPDEVEITLESRLCYELCVFWDRPDAAAAWQAFVVAATPLIEALGGHPLLVFQPLRRVRGDFFPTRYCIAAWDTLERFESFVTAPGQEEISRLRWAAVSRMDATATRLD